MMLSSLLRTVAVKSKAVTAVPAFYQITARSMAGTAQSQTSAVSYQLKSVFLSSKIFFFFSHWFMFT
jgi:hypothetical protein